MRHHHQSWYSDVAEVIGDNLESFLNFAYPESELIPLTKGAFRLQPCPMCGHSDCSHVSANNQTNCFSCKWKGGYAKAFIAYCHGKKQETYWQAIKKLSEFTGIPYPGNMTEEELAEIKQADRMQQILRVAEEHYHKCLTVKDQHSMYQGQIMSAYEYLTTIRSRAKQTIDDFKIGYVANYYGLLQDLKDQGFDDEELKAAKIRLVDGMIVYFYHDPISNEIVRINCKNPFDVMLESEGKKRVLPGYSAFKGYIYASPEFDAKKPVIVVEGENDVQAVYEQGWTNVVGLGGAGSLEKWILLEYCKGPIYIMTDNDEVGRKYVEQLNDLFPHKVLAQLHYSGEFNDPDEYYRGPNPENPEALIETATYLVTEKYRVFHDGNHWTIENRTQKLEYTFRLNRGKMVGRADLYGPDGAPIDRKEDVSLGKCKGKMSPFSFYLEDEINRFFNKGLDQLDFLELAKRYPYSQCQPRIINLLAKKMFERNDEVSDMTSDLKRELSGMGVQNYDTMLDSVLIELNNLRNQALGDDRTIIPKMKIAQYYNLRNNDAYMYFTYYKDDGDAKRAIPYFLKNDGTLIRLDLLKRKDEQCILLVDNRYELPFEIPVAPIEPMYCSLQDNVVVQFRDGELSENRTNPCRLIREIEDWIRKFYYVQDENVFKVLALWIYGTYFYTMFSQYPYLFINGEKGSGKTILNNVISMLAFNAKPIVDISEASLFRTAGVEGGTLILDEQETLTSRKSGASNPFGSILKAGYASGMYISRCNMDSNSSAMATNDLFDPYCPKVIANIFGLEDIISDRCLPIRTYRAATNNIQMEDPKYYIDNDQSGYKDLSSRCCISALQHFGKLNQIFQNNTFKTKNARLSQILTPIFAVAKFVDGDEIENMVQRGINPKEIDVVGEYEKAFTEYYHAVIKMFKQNTEQETPEGNIKYIVTQIARELTDKSISPEYTTITNGRKYSEPVHFNREEGWFELNTVHFTVFLEELMPGSQIYPKHVSKWIQTCFSIPGDRSRRRHVSITNDDLIKQCGSQRPKVQFFRFMLDEVLESNFLNQKEILEQQQEEPPIF